MKRFFVFAQRNFALSLTQTAFVPASSVAMQECQVVRKVSIFLKSTETPRRILQTGLTELASGGRVSLKSKMQFAI